MLNAITGFRSLSGKIDVLQNRAYASLAASRTSPAANNATNSLRSAGSIGVDFIPYVSTAKGIQQALSGVDLITGQKLSSLDRWAEVGGIAASLIPIPGAKLAGKAVTKHAIVGVSKAAEAISGLWKKASAKLSSKGKSTPKLDAPTAGDNIGKQLSKPSENPLANIQYTDKVKNQMQQGDFHSFPTIVDNYGGLGKIDSLKGGDGIMRTRVNILGGYRGREGVFEYIIEPDGKTVNHRLFRVK